MTGRFLVTLAIFWAAPATAQQSAAVLSVKGAVRQPLALTSVELAALPRASITTNNNGIETTYAGVWLSEILKKAGVPLGSALRGPALSAYVLASGSDGYQVLFSLGEVDPEMTGGQFLVADQANGKALFGEDGRLRMVVAGDKRGARSIRMLAALEVVQLRK